MGEVERKKGRRNGEDDESALLGASEATLGYAPYYLENLQANFVRQLVSVKGLFWPKQVESTLVEAQKNITCQGLYHLHFLTRIPLFFYRTILH